MSHHIHIIHVYIYIPISHLYPHYILSISGTWGYLGSPFSWQKGWIKMDINCDTKRKRDIHIYICISQEHKRAIPTLVQFELAMAADRLQEVYWVLFTKKVRSSTGPMILITWKDQQDFSDHEGTTQRKPTYTCTVYVYLYIYIFIYMYIYTYV